MSGVPTTEKCLLPRVVMRCSLLLVRELSLSYFGSSTTTIEKWAFASYHPLIGRELPIGEWVRFHWPLQESRPLRWGRLAPRWLPEFVEGAYGQSSDSPHSFFEIPVMATQRGCNPPPPPPPPITAGREKQNIAQAHVAPFTSARSRQCANVAVRRNNSDRRSSYVYLLASTWYIIRYTRTQVALHCRSNVVVISIGKYYNNNLFLLRCF